MITLKFVGHDGRYQVYSCLSYNVNGECLPADKDRLGQTRRVVRMFRDYQDNDPQFQQVGDTEPYKTCYVMNDAGKTIDTIR